MQANTREEIKEQLSPASWPIMRERILLAAPPSLGVNLDIFHLTDELNSKFASRPERVLAFSHFVDFRLHTV